MRVAESFKEYFKDDIIDIELKLRILKILLYLYCIIIYIL